MNIYFENFKKSAIFQAVKWEGFFNLISFLNKIFLGFLIIVLVFSILGFIQGFPPKTLSVLFGFSILFLSFILIFQILKLFFNSKLKKPQIKYNLKQIMENSEKFNLISFLDYEAARIIKKTLRFVKSRKISQVNSTILLYFILKEKNFEINFTFSRLNLDVKELGNKLKNKIFSKKIKSQNFEDKNNQIQDALTSVAKIAKENNREKIGIGDFLIWIAQVDPFFEKVLVEADIKEQDIENLIWWAQSIEKKISARKSFWEYKNLSKHGSFAQDWVSAYTPTLDKFSIDWREIIKKQGFVETIGHKESIEDCERILAHREMNNVLLVGEPGTGRGSIIQAIAQKALFKESLPEVNDKRVVEINISSIISQSESLETTEKLLDDIFQEVIKAGNIILVINEFHNFVGQIARPGVVDISGIITKYLRLHQYQIIAITTLAGLRKNIENNPSILNLFGKVEISEITQQEAILLLGNLAFILEQKYKKFVPFSTLRHIIGYSLRYLPNLPFPKKAIDLLNEVVIYVSKSTKSQLVLPEHVAEIISKKTHIPVGELKIQERKILLNLENLIHRSVINQEEAVKEICSALKRTRTGITIKKGPMGGFLFLGPTGTGKTETAKALAKNYFGSEERMIRLDMSEFSDKDSVSRLIGSVVENGILTTKIKEAPFSLILLDEIEKAHPDVLNLFLQVLDEGHLTDGLGRKISFSHSIIIATSNAGFQIILDVLKKQKNGFKEIKNKLLDYFFEQAIFRPEFINRFDAMVVFRPLTKKNLLNIADLFFQKLSKNLTKKNIKFIITEELKEKIVELSYSPVFGAREMRRIIQDKVENVLASALLSRELKRGDTIEINPQTFEIIKKINNI